MAAIVGKGQLYLLAYRLYSPRGAEAQIHSAPRLIAEKLWGKKTIHEYVKGLHIENIEEAGRMLKAPVLCCYLSVEAGIDIGEADIMNAQGGGACLVRYQ